MSALILPLRSASPSGTPGRRLVSLAGVLLVLLASCARTSAPSPAAAGRAATAAPHGPWSDDVARLASADFVARSQAAARLVSAGEAALPALGAVGRADVPVPGDVEVSSTAPVLRAIFESLPADRLSRHLESPWPVVRAAAADEAGRRGSWAVVPDLIERLDDADVDVRASAGAALRRLTNRFFDYEADGCVTARRQARLRWETWWRIEGRRGPEERPEGIGH